MIIAGADMGDRCGRRGRLPRPSCARWFLKGDRGFSLVEVLVVASVLAVALLGAATLYPVSQSAIYQAATVNQATNIARNRLELIKNKGTTDGTILPADCPSSDTTTYPGFTFSCNVSPGSPDVPVAASAIVKIVVGWASPPPGSVKLSGLVMRPE